MIHKLITLFFLLVSTSVFAGANALLLIGNMTQQSMDVKGSGSYDSDSYLAPGVGYLYGSSLATSLSWEVGLSYIQRQLGYEDRNLTLPVAYIPLGIRWNISRFSLGLGAYYWKGAGEIKNSKGSSGSFNDFGYKDNGTGAFVQVSVRTGNSSYLEIRKNMGLSNDSDTSNVEITLNDYQIIYGYVISFGGASTSGSSGGSSEE